MAKTTFCRTGDDYSAKGDSNQKLHVVWTDSRLVSRFGDPTRNHLWETWKSACEIMAKTTFCRTGDDYGAKGDSNQKLHVVWSDPRLVSRFGDPTRNHLWETWKSAPVFFLTRKKQRLEGILELFFKWVSADGRKYKASRFDWVLFHYIGRYPRNIHALNFPLVMRCPQTICYCVDIFWYNIFP